jgi:cysteine desulfurase / selenocysteine lyase
VKRISASPGSAWTGLGELEMDAAVSRVRAQSPFLDQLTFFNNGSIAALSLPVREAINRGLDAQAMGTIGRSIWRGVIAPLREKIAALINAEPDEIAILRNTVEGISTVAAGVVWREGDTVVCNDLEFPANVYPWWNLRSRFGVQTTMVPGRDGRILVDDIVAAVDEHTRLITISFVQFSNGFRADLDRLGAFCRERGILLHVDGIQGVGPLRIDVQRSQVDFLACGGHKWLLGPIGIGFLYVRKELIKDLWACEPGHLGVKQNVNQYRDYDLTFRETAEKFEGGVHNYAGAFGLDKSLELFLEVGPDRISRRVLELTDQLCEGLARREMRLLSHRGPGEKSGTVAFQSDRQSVKDIYHQLQDAGIFVTISEGAVRVAPHFFNTAEEIDRLIGTLAGPPVISVGGGR